MYQNQQKEIPILLSLKEIYFDEIKSGVKRYEYRKRYVEQPSLAYMYCSSPTKAIKGIIRFGTPIVGTPEEISAISERETGEGAETAEYLKGKEKGFAIPIFTWEEIRPISLSTLRWLFPRFVPPQSYYRLDDKADLQEYLESHRSSSTR
jgi:predicted transcriptional regulator